MSLLEKFKGFELKNSSKVNGGGIVTWGGSDGNGNTLWDGVSDNGQDESCNNVDDAGYDINVGDPYANDSVQNWTAVSVR